MLELRSDAAIGAGGLRCLVPLAKQIGIGNAGDGSTVMG